MSCASTTVECREGPDRYSDQRLTGGLAVCAVSCGPGNTRGDEVLDLAKTNLWR
jgi:hypothetical protein